ncbi:MAG: MFS transporter [Methanothrix sp.]|jgi:EmrB/QacA subfamily drug resistance transporter|nr:MFS transporter [Methanothrix harundinacea]MDD3710118.1 MFS transporter [Methanothrix sp.]MDD5767415.1 MFS transporter [Methanothrix sp.]
MTEDSSQKMAALGVAATSSFLTPFMGSSVNIALPAIGDQFALDAVTLSWVTTSAVLAAAIFLVPFGRLGDIHGRKRVFTCGVLTYTGSALLCALATSAPMLIVFRFTQGMGGAMIFGTGTAILISAFPARERGKALGVSVAAVYLGLTLGPSLGGFLTHQFGWRAVFLSNLPVGLMVLLLVAFRLKGEWAEARGESFDLFGSALYCGALVATICGFSILPDLAGCGLILLGLLGLVAFALVESRSKSPLLEIGLFRKNRAFAFSNLAALINYSATFGVGFLLSLYLQYVKGLTAQDAGLILIAQPLLMIFVALLSGWLSDRMRPQILAGIGMALTTASLLTLLDLGRETSIASVLSSLAILGLGVGLFSSPNTNAVMSSVLPRFYGVASSTLGTMRLSGHMLSMGMVMLCFSFYMGRTAIAPESIDLFIGSAQATFAAFAVLSFGGIFASISGGGEGQREAA